MKILLSGGGTLGPVVPLLAVAKIYKQRHPEAEFVWAGTKQGPEKALVEASQIRFETITAGKWRRYFSFWNLADIFRIIWAFFVALCWLAKEKPALLITAGGFVSVPLHWAGWVLRIPAWVHQQDYRVGLANKLMAPLATVVTVALEKNTSAFWGLKAVWLGNPVRSEIFQGSADVARRLFKLDNALPVVFVTGGGTGSIKVNQLIAEAVPHLVGVCQIIHLSGAERPPESARKTAQFYPHYHCYQFFTSEMAHAYAVADLIISRGGFGTITEIAALGKPAILIPKPGGQYENVEFLARASAAVLVDEKISDGNYLAKTIKSLLNDEVGQRQLAHNLCNLLPPARPEQIVSVIDAVLKRV